jgi:hypothetical protein
MMEENKVRPLVLGSYLFLGEFGKKVARWGRSWISQEGRALRMK